MMSSNENSRKKAKKDSAPPLYSFREEKNRAGEKIIVTDLRYDLPLDWAEDFAQQKTKEGAVLSPFNGADVPCTNEPSLKNGLYGEDDRKPAAKAPLRGGKEGSKPDADLKLPTEVLGRAAELGGRLAQNAMAGTNKEMYSIVRGGEHSWPDVNRLAFSYDPHAVHIAADGSRIAMVVEDVRDSETLMSLVVYNKNQDTFGKSSCTQISMGHNSRYPSGCTFEFSEDWRYLGVCGMRTSTKSSTIRIYLLEPEGPVENMFDRERFIDLDFRHGAVVWLPRAIKFFPGSSDMAFSIHLCRRRVLLNIWDIPKGARLRFYDNPDLPRHPNKYLAGPDYIVCHGERTWYVWYEGRLHTLPGQRFVVPGEYAFNPKDPSLFAVMRDGTMAPRSVYGSTGTNVVVLYRLNNLKSGLGPTIALVGRAHQTFSTNWDPTRPMCRKLQWMADGVHLWFNNSHCQQIELAKLLPDDNELCDTNLDGDEESKVAHKAVSIINKILRDDPSIREVELGPSSDFWIGVRPASFCCLAVVPGK